MKDEIIPKYLNIISWGLCSMGTMSAILFVAHIWDWYNYGNLDNLIGTFSLFIFSVMFILLGISIQYKINWIRFVFIGWLLAGFVIGTMTSGIDMAFVPRIFLIGVICVLLLRPKANDYFLPHTRYSMLKLSKTNWYLFTLKTGKAFSNKALIEYSLKKLSNILIVIGKKEQNFYIAPIIELIAKTGDAKVIMKLIDNREIRDVIINSIFYIHDQDIIKQYCVTLLNIEEERVVKRLSDLLLDAHNKPPEFRDNVIPIMESIVMAGHTQVIIGFISNDWIRKNALEILRNIDIKDSNAFEALSSFYLQTQHYYNDESEWDTAKELMLKINKEKAQIVIEQREKKQLIISSELRKKKEEEEKRKFDICPKCNKRSLRVFIIDIYFQATTNQAEVEESCVSCNYRNKRTRWGLQDSKNTYASFTH